MEQGDQDIRAGLLLGVAMTIALAFSVVLPFAASPPRTGAPVLVVAPPWSGGAAERVTRAGGRLLGPADAPFAVLAEFPGEIPAATLHRLGAWAVADGRALSAFCGVS